MRHADYRPHRKVVLINPVPAACSTTLDKSGTSISPQPYLKPNAQYYVDVDFGGKIESCLLRRLQPATTQEDRT
jgi:hypothetical protein